MTEHGIVSRTLTLPASRTPTRDPRAAPLPPALRSPVAREATRPRGIAGVRGLTSGACCWAKAKAGDTAIVDRIARALTQKARAPTLWPPGGQRLLARRRVPSVDLESPAEAARVVKAIVGVDHAGAPVRVAKRKLAPPRASALRVLARWRRSANSEAIRRGRFSGITEA